MNRILMACSLSAVALVVSSAAFAEEAAPAANESATGSVNAADAVGDKKIVLGLRLGYGLPMGNETEGAALSDRVSGMIPIWLDLGYMVTPNIMVGAYGQYGFASVKNCPSGSDCSAHDLRFGVQGQYLVSPGEQLDPWFGLGIGYESLAGSVDGADGSMSGLEFANLQAGLDYAVMPDLGVGPFLSMSFGQYSSQSADGDSSDISQTALHEWLTLGLRGAFRL